MEDNLSADLKSRIREFWTRYPCAKNLLERDEVDKDLFLAHDRIIDRLTPYHYRVFQYEECRDKRVLEVGCGMGAHARHFASYAKEFYAIDLSPTSVELTRKRFELYGIKGAHISQGDAERLDFPDNFFDLVYSNGVIHHTPDTRGAVREIYRVLKPGGKATVMIYNKDSIFYRIDLMLEGRLKYALLKLFPEGMVRGVFGRDSAAHKLKEALMKIKWRDLSGVVLCYSDGHFNPHTKVYTQKEARDLFCGFKEVKVELHSCSDRILERIPWINRHFGWGLFIYAKK